MLFARLAFWGQDGAIKRRNKQETMDGESEQTGEKRKRQQGDAKEAVEGNSTNIRDNNGRQKEGIVGGAEPCNTMLQNGTGWRVRECGPNDKQHKTPQGIQGTELRRTPKPYLVPDFFFLPRRGCKYDVSTTRTLKHPILKFYNTDTFNMLCL